MKNCTFCGKRKKKKDYLVKHYQGLYIHVGCIQQLDTLIFGMDSINKEITAGGTLVEHINVLEDKKHSSPQLGMDLRLAVHSLYTIGKTQEAEALQYFIDGLQQSDMVYKFKRNKQRVSQIIASLRKELIKLGINKAGYCK